MSIALMFSVHLGAEYYLMSAKRGKEKTTEETAPKPPAKKTEESTPKKAAEAPEESVFITAAEKPKKPAHKPSRKEPDVVFVGNKPPMSYVMAVITALSSGATSEITLKARGRAITTAVDVAEITCNRFIRDLAVTSIGIGTEELPAREGESKSRNVSIIEIKLAKK
jgi:DNA-binding protein